MIWLALGLFAFAVADLVQWSPVVEPGRRTVVAVAGGAVAAAAIAALAGMPAGEVVAVFAAAVVGLAVWLLLPNEKPIWPLAWIVAVLTALFAVSGSAEPISDDLKSWYSGLPYPFAEVVSVEQFVLAAAATLFLLATANRIVRLVLEAADAFPDKDESSPRGGRLLGPMERLIVAAVVVAGEPAAAALVIAAKSLLRFPEIKGKTDRVTEYFLVGTFTSLVVATLAALMILASG
ncbi:MAG TPA: hypothetical protein VLL27_12610 [Solirubrobacterales bacterium]|nr:hypothetical protein [Solirubrobacterales bacterium]